MPLPNGMKNPIRRKNGRPVFNAPTFGTVKGKTQTRVPKGTHVADDTTTTKHGKWQLVAKVNPTERQQAAGVKELAKQRPGRHKWSRGDLYGRSEKDGSTLPTGRQAWRGSWTRRETSNPTVAPTLRGRAMKPAPLPKFLT